MEKFHAMFHGTDVYINGRYKYSSNEILTAYLNLDLSVEELTEWLFQLKAELRNLKLRVDFSDEERFDGYEKNVQWTQKLIDRIDSVWPMLPPYNRFVQPHQMQKNKLRVCLTRFSDMLDGDRALNPLAGLEFDEDDDEEYISTTVKFVPIDMDWYWTDGNSQYAMDNQRRMNELNQAIEDLMQPYIHWVEDVLRVKCCYEKLLSDFLHIKHGFLTEADLAKQFAAYFKTESMAGMAHRKLNGPAPLTSCHEVFTPAGGAPFLCASYDFDRLGAFLYIDSEAMISGRISRDEVMQLSKSYLEKTRIQIYDNPLITVKDMQRICEDTKNLGAVIIDYFQLIDNPAYHTDSKNRIANAQSSIARELKVMAKNLGAPVICTSQLSKACNLRKDKRPMLSDLNCYGVLQQDADQIILLYRDSYYNPELDWRMPDGDVLECIVAKNRYGDERQG